MPMLILEEVDSGIGGAVADVVGNCFSPERVQKLPPTCREALSSPMSQETAGEMRAAVDSCGASTQPV